MRSHFHLGFLMLIGVLLPIAGCGGGDGHGNEIADFAEPPAQVFIQNDSGYHIYRIRFDLRRHDGTQYTQFTPPELIVFSGESFLWTLPADTAQFRAGLYYQDQGVTYEAVGAWTSVTPGKVYDLFFTGT